MHTVLAVSFKENLGWLVAVMIIRGVEASFFTGGMPFHSSHEQCQALKD